VSPSVHELANKGTDGLFRAYRNNRLDFEKCYRMLPWPDIHKVLAAELSKSGSTAEPPASSEDAPVHGRGSNGPELGVRSSKLPKIRSRHGFQKLSEYGMIARFNLISLFDSVACGEFILSKRFTKPSCFRLQGETAIVWWPGRQSIVKTL